MARKLRTGFELPFSNATGADQNKSLAGSYILSNLYKGYLSLNNSTEYPLFSGTPTLTDLNVLHTTIARTKSNGTRGCVLRGASSSYEHIIDETAFSSGIHICAGIYISSSDLASGRYTRILGLYDGSTSYSVYVKNVSGTHYLKIANNSTSTELQSVSLGTLNADTWYTYKVGVNNTGAINAEFNGTSITSYNTSISFSSWQNISIGNFWQNSNFTGSFYHYLDDLAINDGSGASDNALPNSIRGYNFFDAATLNANSGFSQVGGSGILANLQDGNDDTRVSAQADLSYIDFSLPTLSGTGMSETAANFTKIEAINVYGRQIEATKSGSLLKAKIEDDTAVVSREENLTLPLTVGNDSVTMFDDGSSDWSLTNLDAGDLDLILTFDKP